MTRGEPPALRHPKQGKCHIESHNENPPTSIAADVGILHVKLRSAGSGICPFNQGAFDGV